MTDSIKHFTGFDISGKTEAVICSSTEWESRMKLWGGKLMMRFWR
jgi:hypothetical protein